MPDWRTYLNHGELVELQSIDAQEAEGRKRRQVLRNRAKARRWKERQAD
jgi:hypothetical protein